MKNRLISILLALSLLLTLTACGRSAYEVRFELNGGELISGSLLQHVEKGAAAQPPEVMREGYVLDGWSEDCSSVSGNMVVAARWSRVPEPSPEEVVPEIVIYEVRFELNGGELVSGSLLQKIEQGGAAQPPEVKREGYAFEGWNEPLEDVQGNIVTAAMWRQMYSVRFDPAGGEISGGQAEQLVAAGDLPTAPKVTRENYDFSGWEPAVEAAGGDAVYTALWTAVQLSSEQVFRKIAPAVVEIQLDDTTGRYTTLGTGFFIDDQGTLVTNYHVIDATVSGQVILEDGSKCDIVSVLGYDPSVDLAILRIGVSGNPYLTLSGSGVVTGETIYALGSSEGLTSTFSAGNVSTAARVIDEVCYIQITAPISHGNSGGPLVNSFGEVVGVNTMGHTEGQNLNFAVDIRELDKVDRSRSLSLEEVCALQYPNNQSGGGTNADEGLYDMADYAEEEPNDTFLLADGIKNGSMIAGELSNTDDLDWFYFSVDKPGEAVFIVLPEYQEDMDYLLCGIVRITDEGESEVFDVLERDSRNGVQFMSGTVQLDEPGYYYLVLLIDDDYPYRDPIYYVLEVDW